MNIFYFYDCPKLSAKAQARQDASEDATRNCTNAYAIQHHGLDGDTYADLTGLLQNSFTRIIRVLSGLENLLLTMLGFMLTLMLSMKSMNIDMVENMVYTKLV